MAVGDAHVFPGFLTPVLTQLFFPKPPTTFLTRFCRGERQKYARKKSLLNQELNSQSPGHESDWATRAGQLVFTTDGGKKEQLLIATLTHGIILAKLCCDSFFIVILMFQSQHNSVKTFLGNLPIWYKFLFYLKTAI